MTRSVRERPPVTLITVLHRDGRETLVALSNTRRDRGYALDGDVDGRWLCPCPGFGFKFDCSHTRAASEKVRRERVMVA